MNLVRVSVMSCESTSAAAKAPDFANGLFLSSANLGTTIATMVCGLFISGFGALYVVSGGLLFVVLGIIAIILRVHINRFTNHFS
jgi:predicted MFS family arabinose efflux permease